MMGNNGKSCVALHFYSACERAVKKTAVLPNFNRVTGPSSSKFSLFPSCTSVLPRTSRLLASCLCFAVSLCYFSFSFNASHNFIIVALFKSVCHFVLTQIYVPVSNF